MCDLHAEMEETTLSTHLIPRISYANGSTPGASANPVQPQSNLPSAAILPWMPANLDPISQRFERKHPRELLQWGATTFGDDIVMATGFGVSGVVLMHMASQLRTRLTVFYLQTDLLFPETMELRDRLIEQLGVRFVEVHSGLSLEEQRLQYGDELWKSSPDLCCQLRKVNPLRRFLASKRAWITGIRRDQSASRASAPLVGWDQANSVIKLNPLAGWTQDQVWTYVYQHNLPYNTLHDQGYPSLGCTHCTRKVKPGESERSGRWAGMEKTECGIHVQPDGTIVRTTMRQPQPQ